MIGYHCTFDNTKSINELAIVYTPVELTILENAYDLIFKGKI